MIQVICWVQLNSICAWSFQDMKLDVDITYTELIRSDKVVDVSPFLPYQRLHCIPWQGTSFVGFASCKWIGVVYILPLSWFNYTLCFSTWNLLIALSFKFIYRFCLYLIWIFNCNKGTDQYLFAVMINSMFYRWSCHI